MNSLQVSQLFLRQLDQLYFHQLFQAGTWTSLELMVLESRSHASCEKSIKRGMHILSYSSLSFYQFHHELSSTSSLMEMSERAMKGQKFYRMIFSTRKESSIVLEEAQLGSHNVPTQNKFLQVFMFQCIVFYNLNVSGLISWVYITGIHW